MPVPVVPFPLADPRGSDYPGIGVRLAPESGFGFRRNWGSLWPGIRSMCHGERKSKKIIDKEALEKLEKGLADTSGEDINLNDYPEYPDDNETVVIFQQTKKQKINKNKRTKQSPKKTGKVKLKTFKNR